MRSVRSEHLSPSAAGVATLSAVVVVAFPVSQDSVPQVAQYLFLRVFPNGAPTDVPHRIEGFFVGKNEAYPVAAAAAAAALAAAVSGVVQHAWELVVQDFFDVLARDESGGWIVPSRGRVRVRATFVFRVVVFVVKKHRFHGSPDRGHQERNPFAQQIAMALHQHGFLLLLPDVFSFFFAASGIWIRRIQRRSRCQPMDLHREAQQKQRVGVRGNHHSRGGFYQNPAPQLLFPFFQQP
mmetsp:Transcript_103354/g.210942  ORF Transcript_103354/g.210942 Transcript_103354/m.210942 type:complete len:238 (-) Transcript_103354:367-1080(-)